MSARNLFRRAVASRHAVAVVAVLLLIGLAKWALPVRMQRRAATWMFIYLQALASVWWQALLLVLGFVVLFAVVWRTRSWMIARASAARFFAISLLIHVLFFLSLGAVPLAQAIVEQAEVIGFSQAPELFDEPRASGGGEARPAYEQVADLRPEAPAPVLARQAPPPAATPDAEPAETLVPTIPAHAVRSLPPERVRFVPPPALEVVRQPQEIARLTAPAAAPPIEIPLELPPLPAPEAPAKEKPLTDRPAPVARQGPLLPEPDGPPQARLPELKRPPLAVPAVAELPPLPPAAPAPLPRTMTRQANYLEPAAPSEPEAVVKAEKTPSDRPVARTPALLPRLSAPALPVPVPDAPPRSAPPPRIARMELPRPAPLPDPAIRPVAATLPRPDPTLDRIAGVEDAVAPQATFLLRQKEVRQRSLEMYGGTKASEAAVERGLDWLAAHQNAAGSWSLHNFHVNCKHPRCGGSGTFTSDPAGTGLGLLPFLGAGYTHKTGKHRATVEKALHWLVQQQRPDGTWPAPGDSRPMYGHGLASIALCEAYGMTQDPKLRQPAQKALDYIARAQHTASGGWRYYPNQAADTSVVGWQMMALKSGEMAGLRVNGKTFAGIQRWLRSVEANRPVGGQFGYQSASATPAMTAQGLLCLQYLGARRNDPRMQAGTRYLLGHLPRRGSDSSYYWYHANQVMYHMQGKAWQTWNSKLRDLLVATQVKQGPVAGSWSLSDSRDRAGGRIYATALRLLMLEVYYRHLPLYQQLEK